MAEQTGPIFWSMEKGGETQQLRAFGASTHMFSKRYIQVIHRLNYAPGDLFWLVIKQAKTY
jgi:hypothetical protein